MKTVKPLLLIAALATVMSACSNPQKSTDAQTTDNNVPVLQDTVSIPTAKQMVHNFDSRANHVKKGDLIFSDSRCVWFSRPQLEALLVNLKKEKGTGIRFYFAAYDKVKKPGMEKINDMYLDYTTLVMVSTRDSGAYHYDYFDYSKGTDGRIVNKAPLIMFVPENQGELCPPPEKCDGVGATLLKKDTVTLK